MEVNAHAIAIDIARCVQRHCIDVRYRRRQRPDRAHRRGHLGRGGRHGRRGGQRQEGRLDHHRQRDHRCAGPLCVPGGTARARQIHCQCPRQRLSTRRSADCGAHCGPGRKLRPQAHQAAQPLGASHQRRVDAQHARHRAAEEVPAQLHRLPHARTHHEVVLRSRSVDRRDQPHGDVLSGHHAAVPAAAWPATSSACATAATSSRSRSGSRPST